MGQHELAIAEYNEAVRLKADYVEAYCNRAWNYGVLKKYDEDIADCTTAILLRVNFANDCLRLAWSI